MGVGILQSSPYFLALKLALQPITKLITCLTPMFVAWNIDDLAFQMAQKCNSTPAIVCGI